VLLAVQKVLGTSVEAKHEARRAGDEPVQTCADISATRAIGWEPRVDLETGIRSMVSYIRQEMEAGRIPLKMS
jgi:nucleoside-diphosphate-sugar epimerase